jgi:hypothetical protein
VIAFVATDVALRSAATTFEFSADVDSVLMTAWAAFAASSSSSIMTTEPSKIECVGDVRWHKWFAEFVHAAPG